MQSKLAHVCIETADLDATEAFYAVLGLERRFDFHNQHGDLVGFYLAFSNNTYVEVIKVRKPRPEGAVRHFAIEIDEVDAWQARLRQAGIEVTEKEYAGDDNWMITCHDPNGIFIELQEYTEKSMQKIGGSCKVEYVP
ncbi:MAG: VOC family protein [Xanthomonadales bacterium]|nr:VOC family protein [Xanthomonadales bacterium]